jgi:ABC-2 type transport system ATP-binding protein
MDHGKLLALDTPEALMRSLSGSSTLELTTQSQNGHVQEQVLAELRQLSAVDRVEPLQDDGRDGQGDVRLRLYVTGEAAPLVAPAAELLAQRGLTLSGVEIGAPTLEDVFINLTGRTLR